MKKYKKLLFLASMLWLCASGYAQEAKRDSSLNLRFNVVEVNPTGDGNCIPHVGGTKTYRVTHNCPYIYEFTYQTVGDIKIRTFGADSVVVEVKDLQSFGKGRLYVTGYYRLPDTLPCVSTDCWLTTGSIDVTIDLFQKFTIDDLPTEFQQIAGAKCLQPDEKYPYSVEPILTKGFSYNIGIDIYKWELPQSGSTQETYRAEDQSSITLELNTGREIGLTDTLKVWFGRCNFDSEPLTKVLRPSSKLPEVAHDSLDCIQTDTVHFEVIDGRADHEYWFTFDRDFGYERIDGRPDNINVFTQGFSGKVTLHASNTFDTISKDFYISRRTYLSSVIEGDSTCLNPNSTLMFRLYPSPNVDITWELPEGWQGDKVNPNSSTVYFTLNSNAVSGAIVASSKECPTTFDSLFVSVQSSYDEEKGIHTTDDITCFTIGKETGFYVNADPSAEGYEWIFPEAWNMPNHIVSNPMDTVVQITIGNTKGTIKVIGKTCDNEWKRTFEVNQFAPVAPTSIVLDGKSCVNSGLADTITLVAVGAQEVTFYKWNYPAMWERLEPTTDSVIRLVTNGNATGNYDVSVSVGNDGCASNTVISTTIVQDGVGVPVSIVPGAKMGPKIMLTVNPNSSSMYNYKWQQVPMFNQVSITAMYLADTGSNYCVSVSLKNGVGCASMVCREPITTNINPNERDSITVPTVPPAVTPPALSSLFTPIDEDSEEKTEEEPTPPSVQKNAPKVEPLAKKNEIEPSFTFYPNPATQNIYVRFNGNADQIEILNLSGVTLIKERCSGTEKEINISHLHIGLYIVKVKFGNKILTEKLQILK